MKLFFIFFSVFLVNLSCAFGAENFRNDQDFEDDEDFDGGFVSQNQDVKLSDSNFTRRVSILFIKGYRVLLKITLPVAKVYGNVTTNNFKQSVLNWFALTGSVRSFVSSVFVFSPQIALASLGKLSIDVTLGLGFLDASNALDVKDYNISIADTLRFYKFPEWYFVFLGYPQTLVTSLSFVASFYIDDLILPFSTFSFDTAFFVFNSISLNADAMYGLLAIKPEQAYYYQKNMTEALIRNFKLNRSPMSVKTKDMLKNFIKNQERNSF